MAEIFPNMVPDRPIAAVGADQPPVKRRPRYIRQGKKLIDAVAVAKMQRYAILTVLVGLVVYFSLFAFMIVGFGPRPGPNSMMVGVLFVNFLMLACGIATIVVAAMLAHRLKYHAAVIVISCIFMLIPFIGLLILLSINGRATTILRLTGAHVGLLGVSQSELAKLYEGACSNCGYDLTQLGTAERCPECGERQDARVIRT